MIFYVNGDSHAAAAEAVNPHAWAKDDGNLFYMGRAPHPENLAVSWGRLVADSLRATFHCDAEAGCSNYRIMRTTRDWLARMPKNVDVLVAIQWTTWEREEWQDEDGTYFQVNASGLDEVPVHWQERYKNFIVNVDWNKCTQIWHQLIWQFHMELKEQNIPHIFFNGNNDFSKIADRKDWGINYIGPYDPKQTFDSVIRAQGIDTVAPNSWHFGRDGHSYFHRFMLQYIIANKLI